MWQSAGLLSCVRVAAKQTKYAHQPAKNWCARIYHLSLSLFRYHLFKITSFLINFRQLPCISSYKKQFHMPEYHFCPHYETVHHNAAPEFWFIAFSQAFSSPTYWHKLLISLSEKIIAPLYFYVYVSLIRFDYILYSAIAVLVLSFRAVDLISGLLPSTVPFPDYHNVLLPAQTPVVWQVPISAQPIFW